MCYNYRGGYKQQLGRRGTKNQEQEIIHLVALKGTPETFNFTVRQSSGSAPVMIQEVILGLKLAYVTKERADVPFPHRSVQAGLMDRTCFQDMVIVSFYL